jgi:hypothetical protein
LTQYLKPGSRSSCVRRIEHRDNYVTSAGPKELGKARLSVLTHCCI